jgi:hypothetical protein
VAIGLWECQSGLLLYRSNRTKIGGEVSGAGTICGTRPVDVKVKMYTDINLAGEN